MVLGALREGVQREQGRVIREVFDRQRRLLPVRVQELADEPLGLPRKAGLFRAQGGGAEQEHCDVLGGVGEADPVDVDYDDVRPVDEHVGRRVLAVGRDERLAPDGRQRAKPLQAVEEQAQVFGVVGRRLSEPVRQIEDLDPVAGRLAREARRRGGVEPGQPAGGGSHSG